MTRFDAADPAERQLLYAEAIQAHRKRASPYLTVEVEADQSSDDGDELDGGPIDGDGATDESAPGTAPWVQFGDGVVNLDCTDAELDRLEDLLGQFPAFKIAELTRPDEAEGTNVRISAKADAKRIAEFIERTFRVVYGLEADYWAWVAEI